MGLLIRTTNPSTIMYTRFGGRLLSNLCIGIPAIIENGEKNFDMMFISNSKELIHPVFKPFRILLPGQIVQINTHYIHSNSFSPSKFSVYGNWVKGFGLPHFQLIDGCTGQKISSYQPGLFAIPFSCFLGRPDLLRMAIADNKKHYNKGK